MIELQNQVNLIRTTTGKHIILTNGCYDLLHYGHIKHLLNIKHIAAHATNSSVDDSYLIVAVNSDASYLAYKRSLPAIEEMDRAVAVDALDCVDVVYIMQDTSPTNTIEAVKPNIYIKGPDRGDPSTWPEWQQLNRLSILALVDKTNGSMRTSQIKEKIKNDI